MTEEWLRQARARLRERFEAGCWLALVVRAIEPRADPGTGERTPAHFLVGAWSPGADGLYARLPEFAAIASPDATRALRELFVHLPATATVHLTDEEHADPALLARMVLVCDGHLEPYQRDALEAFERAARERLARTIAARYTDRDSGFVRFRERLPGEWPREPRDAEGSG